MLKFIFPSLFLFYSNFSVAADYKIKKNDGSFSYYKFLPVHPDPTYAAVVQSRLAEKRSSLNIPASYEIPRENLPRVRDQGPRGTCAYFATLGLLEKYYLNRTNTNIDLSEECLVGLRNWMFDAGASYSGDDKPTDRPDPNGDMPDLIAKTILQNGVPLEKKYNSVDCRYNSNSDKAVSQNNYAALFSEIPNTQPIGKGFAFDLNRHPTIDDIRLLISKNIPVEVGILVYYQYFSSQKWRYNSFYDSPDNLAGGHAIILTGYRTAGNSTIFTFKNSWGQTWGSNGYGSIDDLILTHSWASEPGFDFIISAHD